MIVLIIVLFYIIIDLKKSKVHYKLTSFVK